MKNKLNINYYAHYGEGEYALLGRLLHKMCHFVGAMITKEVNFGLK